MRNAQISYSILLSWIALLVAACATPGPSWIEPRFSAARDAAAAGKFDAAYVDLDSIVQYGDAATRSQAVALIKADGRILTAGASVVARTLRVNASNLEPDDFKDETRFRAAISARHAFLSGQLARYKELAPQYNEDAVLREIYAELRDEKLAEASKQRQAPVEKRDDWLALLAKVVAAEENARYGCDTMARCDKAFALTQIFISKQSDMKLQVATNAVIETYNPTDAGKVGMKAIRLPQRGDSAMIILTVVCKAAIANDFSCANRKLAIYERFVPFVSSMGN